MNKDVIILGGGGHARVLADALLLDHISITGFSDAAHKSFSVGAAVLPYLGTDEEVFDRFSPEKVWVVNGLGSTGDTLKRRQLYEKYKSKGYDFLRVIHPSVVLAGDAVLGEGVQIMAGAVLQTGVRVGSNTIINTRSSIDHDCDIGGHVHIAPGVTLSGAVKVGEGSHVGTGAIVVQGVDIPSNSFIKAGQMVAPGDVQGKEKMRS